MDSPCLICCADGKRAEFKCPLCPQAACTECWLVCIYGDKSKLGCFDCKRAWVVETLLGAPSFAEHHKDILDHVGDIECEKEQALLAASQEEAALVRQLRALSDQRAALGTLKTLARRFKKSQAEECAAAKAEHRLRIGAIDRQANALRESSELFAVFGAEAGAGPQRSRPPVAYIQRCDDPCRGFVSASDLSCSLCGRRACRRCGVMQATVASASASALASAPHTCDPNEIATYEERRKNNKLCPSCHVEIHKASGCDQMYCINCHTAFSWSTLTIDRGSIHNPEYFRYLASLSSAYGQGQGEAVDVMRMEDVACGELPPFALFVNRVHLLKLSGRVEFQFITAFYAGIEHVRSLIPHAAVGMRSNLDIRVAYINGAFDMGTFRSRIKHRLKRGLKANGFRDLLNFILTILIGSARNIAFATSVDTYHREITTLKNFVDLVDDEYIPTLLGIHGGAVPRSMTTIFTGNFRSWLARAHLGLGHEIAT